jgi:predicted Zn-dependent peptidase
LEREKGVIVEEISMYEDSPTRHIGDIFDRMMFAGSKIGQDIIGTRDTVKNMKREDFINHFRKWYGLSNIVLVVAGDADVVNADGFLTHVEGYFNKGDVKDRATTTDHTFTGNPISPTSRLLIDYKKTEQAHFILGFPSFKRGHKDRFVLSVLSTILGGNMSSRLFTEVREKRGLCYYVHTDIDTFHDGGVFGAGAGVDPTRVDEALQVTLDEFRALKEGTKPVTPDELQRAKDYCIGHLILGMEDSQSVGQYYGMKQLLEGKIITLDEAIASLQAVTMDDINRVIQEVIHMDEVRFAMIGPFEKQEDRFKKILGQK